MTEKVLRRVRDCAAEAGTQRGKGAPSGRRGLSLEGLREPTRPSPPLPAPCLACSEYLKYQDVSEGRPWLQGSRACPAPLPEPALPQQRSTLASPFPSTPPPFTPAVHPACQRHGGGGGAGGQPGGSCQAVPQRARGAGQVAVGRGLGQGAAAAAPPGLQPGGHSGLPLPHLGVPPHQAAPRVQGALPRRCPSAAAVQRSALERRPRRPAPAPALRLRTATCAFAICLARDTPSGCTALEQAFARGRRPTPTQPHPTSWDTPRPADHQP